MCDNKVVWGIIRPGQQAVPSCSEHVGQFMEKAMKLGKTDYQMGYLGNETLPVELRCGWGIFVTDVELKATVGVAKEVHHVDLEANMQATHSLRVH